MSTKDQLIEGQIIMVEIESNPPEEYPILLYEEDGKALAFFARETQSGLGWTDIDIPEILCEHPHLFDKITEGLSRIGYMLRRPKLGTLH